MGTIFSEYDIRGRAGQTLTVEYAWTVGKAFAEWLTDEQDIVVAKANDADETITHALTEGLLLQGRDVVAIGDGSDELIVASIRDNQASGGVLLSHDALQEVDIITLFDTNGVKITAETGLVEIEELIDAGNFLPASEKGEVK
ncbi:MAG: hypothetical protein WAW80_01985 [Candidatus Saccharimonadales bacterium]